MEEKMVLLSVENIKKTFTLTKAVDDISLNIYRGEVHGLIGENGSGKSTFSSILSGVLKADSGVMYKEGKVYRPDSMIDGRRQGVTMLVQESRMIQGLSVMQNMFLGNEKIFTHFGVLNKREMYQTSKDILRQAKLEQVDPLTLSDNISFEDKKLIELAMALHDEPDLLIFDETTTSLSHNGRKLAYQKIEELKEDNRSILFISHDLQELQDVCDCITVFRDGKFIKTISKNEFSTDYIRRLMIGRDLSGQYYREKFNADVQGNESILRVDHVTAGSALKDVSFELKKGEILGIGGVADSGVHELCRVMFGITKPEKGQVVYLPNNTKINKADTAVKNKIAYIPKDRDMEAIFPAASIRDNISLMSLEKLKKGPFISHVREKRLAREQVDLLSIKVSSIDQLCMYLSGGNKQKVAITKWLANDSEILIMEHPTRGIDVGVKVAIYKLMEELILKGKSIIMVSEELPEIIGMADRVIVFKHGQISGEFTRESGLSEMKLIQKMI